MRTFVCFWIGVFFAMSVWGQNTEEIVYTFQNGEIQVNDLFQTSSNIGEETGITPYKEVGIVSLEADTKNYNLKVLNFNGWRGEGGDFRIIRLYDNTSLILEFIDEEAWREPYSEFNESVSKYASFNDYCLVYPLQNGVTALLFEGFFLGESSPIINYHCY